MKNCGHRGSEHERECGAQDGECSRVPGELWGSWSQTTLQQSWSTGYIINHWVLWTCCFLLFPVTKGHSDVFPCLENGPFPFQLLEKWWRLQLLLKERAEVIG